jgi:hypothetical protein
LKCLSKEYDIISSYFVYSEKIWKMWKKSKLNSEKIGKIWKKSELNSEKIGRFSKVNSALLILEI